ncbi:hypothetical protein AX16_010957 [Volvariella volvacea WC 439]|nr:hypothetical protein AX16_010957 [Volvariella volvacea WC 439]
MANTPAIALGTLKNVSETAPVLLLSQVAALALSIYEIAQTAHENGEAVRSMATSVIERVYVTIVDLQCKGRAGEQYTPQVEANFKQLLDCLTGLSDCVKQHIEKHRWYVSTNRPDKNAINSHWASILRAFTTFGVQENANLKDLVDQRNNEHQRFMQQIAQKFGGIPAKVDVKELYGSMMPTNS